jgi:hypothetical protein
VEPGPSPGQGEYFPLMDVARWAGRRIRRQHPPTKIKSFLLLFFKKEALASLKT